MTIKIVSAAIDDLRVAADFYEAQGNGLGSFFLDSLFSDIDSLVLYAGIHRTVFGYFRLLSRRFPYAIYYIVDEDTVVVRRVLDMRRDPKRTQEALLDR